MKVAHWRTWPIYFQRIRGSALTEINYLAHDTQPKFKQRQNGR